MKRGDFIGRELIIEQCSRCKCLFAMPQHLYAAAQERRGPNGIQFYCPNGHSLHYLEGESEADKLRRELQRAQQNVAMWEDEWKAASAEAERERRQTAAYKGQVTRLKKRANAGLCPCCNRHFDNLQRHMATKHSDMDPAEVPPELRVVEGGKSA